MMTSEPPDALLAWLDGSLERLEDAQQARDAEEAFLARMHAAQHPDPPPAPTEEPSEPAMAPGNFNWSDYIYQASQRAADRAAAARRKNRYQERLIVAIHRAALDPTNQDLADKVRVARTKADDEMRKWQENLS